MFLLPARHASLRRSWFGYSFWLWIATKFDASAQTLAYGMLTMATVCGTLGGFLTLKARPPPFSQRCLLPHPTVRPSVRVRLRSLTLVRPLLLPRPFPRPPRR